MPSALGESVAAFADVISETDEISEIDVVSESYEIREIDVVSESGEMGQNLSNDIFWKCEAVEVIERGQGHRSASIVYAVPIDHKLFALACGCPVCQE